MKAISILGSTGSIGTQTLDIVEHHPDRFRVVGLAAGRNVTLLAEQVRQFQPEIVAIQDESKLPELREAIAQHRHLFCCAYALFIAVLEGMGGNVVDGAGVWGIGV